MADIEMIERNWKQYKTRPKKLNIRKFKSQFSAVLKGWKIRKVIKNVKKMDEVRELLDCIKLDTDMWQERGEKNLDGF